MTSLIYSTGTVSVSNGSAVVTGSLTGWAVALVKGGGFSCAGFSIPIASVEDDTHLTLAYPWPGSTGAGLAYAISRDSSEAVQAAWTNDRLATIIQRLSLVGVHPDGSGTIAERDALSPAPDNGFLWLHAQPGFALAFYRKVASGWEGPYSVDGEGPQGEPGSSQVTGTSTSSVAIGTGTKTFTVTETDRGWKVGARLRVSDTAAPTANYMEGAVTAYSGITLVISSDLVGGSGTKDSWSINLAGQKGTSLNWQGTYSAAAAYSLNDAVLDNNSSWRAKVATTGNAPPTLPTISNTQWELIAAKGQDGTGTGDMVGPAGAVADRIVVFNGTTGKLTKDGGKAVADFATAAQGTLAQSALQPSSLNDLNTTVSQLAMQAADSTNVAQFLGPTGNRFADSFKALTYVDVAGATNLDTSVVGVLKASNTGTLITVNAPSGAGVVAGNMYVDRSTAVLNSVSVGKIGIYSTDANAVSLKIYLRTSATGGEVVVNENVSHPGGGWFDVVLTTPYSVPPTGTYYLACGVAASGATPDRAADSVRSYRAGNPGVGPVTGMTETPNGPVCAMRYAYNLTTANLTVRSTAFTAAAAPTKLKGLLRVKEVVAATAGTDYTLECSRDGGTTWTVMALTEMYVAAGLLYVDAAETSVAGQPSGTAPRWRFKTLNNKNVEIHDVYLYWT